VAKQLVELLNEPLPPLHSLVSYDRELLDKVAEELHIERAILDMLELPRR